MLQVVEATSCSYEFKAKHFGFSDCKQEKFYVSQWSNKRIWKIAFLLYKVVFVLYAFSWIIIDISTETLAFWIYLTNWTAVTVFLYFLLSLISVVYGFTKGDSNQDELNFLVKIVWIMLNTATSAALVTDFMFWTFLSGQFSSQVLGQPLNIQEHAVNYIMLLIDLFLNDIPIRLLHFIYPMGYAIIYVLFTVMLWASGFTPAVYSILNWEKKPLLASLLSLCVIFIAAPTVHALHFGLYHLRLWLAGCCLTKSGEAALPDENVEMEELNKA